MKRLVLSAAVIACVAAAAWLQRAQAQEPNLAITAGCGIPTSYGKLVSIIPGNTGGPNAGTTYAVFEAEDGVIRWVAAAATGSVLNTQTPPRGQVLPAFIQRYECMLGSEWKRH